MFKTPLKIVLAASVALPAFLAIDVAQAGHKKKNRHHNAQQTKNHHNYNRGHRNYNRGHRNYNRGHRGYRNGYNYRSHRSYGYYPTYYYGGYSGGHHRYGRGHHSKVGTYASLALLGAALGVIIHNSSKNRYQDDGYSNNRNYAPQQPYQGGYANPQTQAPQNQASPNQGGFDFSQCRETRDYETTITVDGQEQLAYGTACMIEDGSWVAGPMQIGR